MQTPFGAEGDGLRWAWGLVKWQRSNKDFCLFGKLRLITLNNVSGSGLKRVRFILWTVVMDSAGICRISWTGTHQICMKSLLLMPRTHTYTHTVNEYGAMSSTANNPAARFISRGLIIDLLFSNPRTHRGEWQCHWLEQDKGWGHNSLTLLEIWVQCI